MPKQKTKVKQRQEPLMKQVKQYINKIDGRKTFETKSIKEN